jgi:hypothetical protein
MYNINKTLNKVFSEGGAVSILGVVALAIGGFVAQQAAKIGIDISPEWVVVGLTAVSAAIWRGLVNWYKHRDTK